MTMEEKLAMYAEKMKFIENLNTAFQQKPRCGSVDSVAYEVYLKDYGQGRIDIREWIILNFLGGGQSFKIVTGNSNVANFAAISSMLNGGFYEQVQCYHEQTKSGYTKLTI